jgi:hypothetical protein
MHTQPSSPLRWTRAHQREIRDTVALAVVGASLVALLPLLVALGLVERSRDRRKPPAATLILRALVRALVWLFRDLTDSPQGPWHPCAQCGQPILEPSRATYCSHACRNYARLERDAQANDPRIAERARRRLRAIDLRELAETNPEWDEVPF